ncbi:hypothetical protein GLYMA_20G241000v4 [Glycine max]|uniref:Uncharacterized protein n=1 Tax=Glycine max TaxID=3847 RepID=A0A0R0ES34_SOYBN|nr:hypothetical protein GLYMA_20G241000v4 [Glycine max]
MHDHPPMTLQFTMQSNYGRNLQTSQIFRITMPLISMKNFPIKSFNSNHQRNRKLSKKGRIAYRKWEISQ